RRVPGRAVAARAGDAVLVPGRHLVGVTGEAAGEVDLVVRRADAVPGDAGEGLLGLLLALQRRVARPVRRMAARAGVGERGLAVDRRRLVVGRAERRHPLVEEEHERVVDAADLRRAVVPVQRVPAGVEGVRRAGAGAVDRRRRLHGPDDVLVAVVEVALHVAGARAVVLAF